MALVSNQFILFVLFCLIIFYIVPKKLQWVVLLVFSYVYYMMCSVPATFILMGSTLVTYLCGLWIGSVKKRTEDAKKAKQISKRIIILGLLLNLGMLAFIKYTNFVIENINAITKGHLNLLNLILPLGISYYTFQSIGYLMDVYWGKAEAEKNPFKFALFVSFFPQLLQGPIGRFSRLGKQLYAEHTFQLSRIKYGLERIAWGFFKKMIIAEWAAVYREAIFSDPDKFAGIAIFGVLLYTAELYGDFSGGMDIVLGVASMFDITLDENFTRPFFAVSIADFWRRWHITLGTWMKDYVFYPLSLSKAMRKLGKGAKKVFGKKIGRSLPICLSNLLVFFLVGIWHGANWNNIGWGLYNGVIIGFSELAMPAYQWIKKKLHINDKAKWYHLFMMLRTFGLMNLSWYFDCSDSAGKAFTMIRNSVTHFQPAQFLEISSGKLGTAYTPYALLTLVVACVILFVVSALQERGIKIRKSLDRIPLVFQLAVFLLLLICIPLFAPTAAARGFIYAQF